MATGTKGQRAAEQLLTPGEAAAKLGISERQFYYLRPRLIARGMETVTYNSIAGKRPTFRYRAASIDRMIRHAAERGEPIC